MSSPNDTNQYPPDDGDQEEKPKRKQKRDDREVEWAFDFAEIGKGINRMFDALAGGEEVKTSEYTLDLDGTTSARIEIDYSVGHGSLRATETAGRLFEAQLVHVGDVEFVTSGEAEKTIKLFQRVKRDLGAPIRQGFRALANREDLRWDVAVTPAIPLHLNIDGGVGPVELDLTGLNLRGLQVDSGVGTMHITLPQQEETLRADLEGGVGQLSVTMPSGLDAELDIEGGIGSIDVTIPEDVAVQVHVDGGIGGVRMPQHMVRVAGKKEFLENDGVWQTEGFDLAQKRVVIHYEGGVGQFTLRKPKVV